MSDRMDEFTDDLAYDEAEGAANLYDDGADAVDVDQGEDDEFLRGLVGTVGRAVGGLTGGGDGADELDELDEHDEHDGADLYEATEGETDSMEDAVADALEVEDSDEFLRRLGNIARRAGRFAGRAGRLAGRAGRLIGPIASAIPLPQAQAIGRIASGIGRVLADGADEFEALEDVFDLAESEDAIDAAAPVIAGLTVRQRMPNIARAPRPVRRQLVRGATQAVRTLARAQGPAGARAVGGVVGRVQQAVRRRAVSPRRMGAAVRRVAQTVARNPRAVRALATRGARPTAGAPVAIRGATGRGGAACPHCHRARTFALRGPVQITIRGR